MSENIDFSLMMDIMRDTNRKVTRTAEDMSDVKQRMTLLEQGLANMNSRMDRFERRLDQIEITIGINETKQ